jgi:hypothetical protein
LIRRLPLLALGALVVVLHVFPLSANDLWMHLLLGQEILHTGIPHQEAYSYTAAGQPFVYHEWLAGVLFHILDAMGGSTLLILLQPACALLTVGLLYGVCRSMGADAHITVLVLAAGIYVSSFRLFLRPHLLVVPLLAAMLLLLQRLRASGGWTPVALLVLTQVLWTNLHGSFPEGIALAVLFGAGEWVRRRFFTTEQTRTGVTPLRVFALLPVALAVASLLNPYGWKLLWLAVAHPVDPLFQARIFEYFPPFSAAFRATRMFWLFLGWLALLLAGLWGGRKRLDPAYLLPTAGFLVLSLWMNRAIPELVMVSLPLVAVGLSIQAARMTRRWKPAVPAAVLVLAASTVLGFGYRFDSHTVRRFGLGIDPFTPVAAADTLQDLGFRGNLFCSFPYGSYLAYRLTPRARVVFDSRTIPYGTDVYQEFRDARSSLEGFQLHLTRHPVDAVLLNFKLDGALDLHGFLGSSPQWGLVYFDEQAVLYLRRTAATAALLDRRRIVCANPVLFDQRGIPAELAAQCREECGRLLAANPDAVLPRFFLAAALEAEGRLAEALSETDRLLASGVRRVYVHRLRATLFQALGQSERVGQETRTADALERR